MQIQFSLIKGIIGRPKQSLPPPPPHLPYVPDNICSPPPLNALLSLKLDVICVSPLTKIPVFLQLGCEFEITTAWNVFTCNVHFSVWRHYLECQRNVINVKNLYEILRYLFQILATPLAKIIEKDLKKLRGCLYEKIYRTFLI